MGRAITGQKVGSNEDIAEANGWYPEFMPYWALVIKPFYTVNTVLIYAKSLTSMGLNLAFAYEAVARAAFLFRG